jgi:hypothetical protein
MQGTADGGPEAACRMVNQQPRRRAAGVWTRLRISGSLNDTIKSNPAVPKSAEPQVRNRRFATAEFHDFFARSINARTKTGSPYSLIKPFASA